MNMTPNSTNETTLLTPLRGIKPSTGLAQRSDRSSCVLPALLSGFLVVGFAAPSYADIPSEAEIEASQEREDNGEYDPDPGGYLDDDDDDDNGSDGIVQIATVVVTTAFKTMAEKIEDAFRRSGRVPNPSAAAGEQKIEGLFWRNREVQEHFLSDQLIRDASDYAPTYEGGGGGGGYSVFNPLVSGPRASEAEVLQKLPSTHSDYCLWAGSDNDGDGWGWENGRSCIALFSSVPDQGAIDKMDFVITNLVLINGWAPQAISTISGPYEVIVLYTKEGEEREYSVGYRLTGNTIEVVSNRWDNGELKYSQVAYTATLGSPPASGSAPCIDPDGDGWGWDGTQSCRP